MPIKYVIGDATRPELDERQGVIVHVCNDVGAWGAGFVLAISRRWSEPEERYRNWHKHGHFVLGGVQYVRVEPNLLVANLIGQAGVGSGRLPPVRYDAIRAGLLKIARYAKHDTVHMPRIGCGLAGGSWDRIEPIIQETLIAAGVPVTVYDLR